MTRLTLITHVYNAQAGVDHHLALWRRYPPALLAELEFLVVDDHSDPPITVDRRGLNLRLLRVEDDIAWNMPGCRNLAAMQARSDWLLFFDVDNVTSETNIHRMMLATAALDRSRLHVFARQHDGVAVAPHINSFLISRWGYFRAGGYDEDFAGHYGFEDVLFRNLWRKHVGKEVLLPDMVFEQMGWRTNNLDRDTTHNQALANFKAALGLPKPKGCLRFGWSEVELA